MGAGFSETLVKMAAKMPRPVVTASLMVVWKTELTMDCCDLGNEDTTYIWDVSGQQYDRDWLGGIS